MKPLLRKIHRWAGLLLVLPLVVQGLTGFLMVLLPAMVPDRPAAPGTGAILGAEALVAAAAHAVPADLQPLRYAPPRRSGDAAMVEFGHGGGRAILAVALDPAEGRILSVGAPGGPVGVIRRIHTALLLPAGIGGTVIGSVGIGLFLLCLTGIPIWWPSPRQRRDGTWRRQFTVSSRSRGARFWREGHMALGGWMVAMLLVMSSTGILLSFPSLSRPLLGGGPPPSASVTARGAPAHGGHAAPGEPAQGLDRAIAHVAAAEPGAQILFVGLGRQFQLRLRLPDGQVVNGSIGHGATATLQFQGGRRGNTAMGWLHGLHQANLPLGGVAARVWSVLVGATGLSLVLFAVTGFAYWLSRQRRKRVQADVEVVPTVP